ncbi:MAG: DUF4198 domain-containing protein [Thermoanaerobaculia bacterium]
MSERVGSGAVCARVCLAVVLAALASPGSAAELWLHPVLPPAVVKAAGPPVRRGARPARPAAPAPPFPTALSGDSSFVELTSGERYPEAASAVPPERIDRSFVRLGEGRPMPLTSAKVDGPVTRLEATWAGQGLATLAVLLAPEARTVEAADFEAFLRDAGAAAAAADRAKRKETKKPAKVVAFESARAFAGVLAPPRSADPVDPAAGADAPIGLPLEIVAGVPPLPLRAGSTLTATVLLDGQPAPGAAVRAFAADGGAASPLAADEKGVVSLPLAREGRLLLSTVSVRRTTKADRSKGEAWKKADWEVRRATLELLVLPPAPAPTPAPKGKGPTPKPR